SGGGARWLRLGRTAVHTDFLSFRPGKVRWIMAELGIEGSQNEKGSFESPETRSDPRIDAAAQKDRWGWARSIVDHNPFFLLSGVCMLAGCFLISGAVHDNSNRVAKLLLLLGVLNVYEAAVTGLGLLLARKRGLVSDAAYL